MCGRRTKVCWAFWLWGSMLGMAAGQTSHTSSPPARSLKHRPRAINPATPSTAVLPVVNTTTENPTGRVVQPHCTSAIYKDRLLTVSTSGCPLDDVLNAIHDTTGIRFDRATDVSQRMVRQLGPAPPNVVLRQLFKDSPFDYMMVGGNDAPNVVRLWRSPPAVVYERGLLTVEATGATLADVLQVIRDRAGIQFEGTIASQEKVVVKLGPGPPVDVLNELFRGSHFDFVILGQARPSMSLRVVLSPAQDGSATAAEPMLTAETPQPETPQPEPPVVGRGRRRFAQVQPLDQSQPGSAISTGPQQAPATLPGGVNFIVPPQIPGGPPPPPNAAVGRAGRPSD